MSPGWLKRICIPGRPRIKAGYLFGAMSLTISTRAFDRIKLLDGSPVVPFTGKLRVRSTARPQVPMTMEKGSLVPATLPMPGFPGVRIPRAYVDPGAIGRPAKLVNFRKSHKRMRRKILKGLARYCKRRWTKGEKTCSVVPAT